MLNVDERRAGVKLKEHVQLRELTGRARTLALKGLKLPRYYTMLVLYVYSFVTRRLGSLQDRIVSR